MHSATLLFILILFLASIQEHHCQQQCSVFSSRDNFLKAEPGSYLNFTFSISSSCYSPGGKLEYVLVYNDTSHTGYLHCQIIDISSARPVFGQTCFYNPGTREFTVRIYKHGEQNETWKVVAVFNDGGRVSDTVHIGVNDEITDDIAETTVDIVGTTADTVGTTVDTVGTTADTAETTVDTVGTTVDTVGTGDPREASSETIFTLERVVVAGSVVPVLVIVAIVCFLCGKRSARTHGRHTSRMSPPSPLPPPPAHAPRVRPIPPNHSHTEGHYTLPRTPRESRGYIPMGTLASNVPEASQSTTAPSTSQTAGDVLPRQLSCPDVSLALDKYGYLQPVTSK